MEGQELNKWLPWHQSIRQTYRNRAPRKVKINTVWQLVWWQLLLHWVTDFVPSVVFHCRPEDWIFTSLCVHCIFNSLYKLPECHQAMVSKAIRTIHCINGEILGFCSCKCQGVMNWLRSGLCIAFFKPRLYMCTLCSRQFGFRHTVPI